MMWVWASFVLGLFSVELVFAHGLDPGNWDSCEPDAEVPPTRVDTTERVSQLRGLLIDYDIHAYLVPNEDAHQSEYPSEYDKRRDFISGFGGSAGFAVITRTKQALWTDGRYFLEAEDTLDCNWILMRQGETGVPDMLTWLIQELSDGQTLGANPFLISSAGWQAYESSLVAEKLNIKAVPDLIDIIWTNDTGRPAQPNTPINALPFQFAGLTWQRKVNDMRDKMAARNSDMLVVTGLDETAWLFNLRADDIEYNPFFISYAIIETTRIRLYIVDHLKKLTSEPTDEATNVTLATHLNTGTDGSCTGREGSCVEVLPYVPGDVVHDVNVSALTAQKIWVAYSCNYAIYRVIPQDKIYQANTPVATTKTNKNSVEVEGMRNSHIRDAAALISFLAKLEPEVQAGKNWTELSAAMELARYRRKQEHNRGLSFPSISGSGPNGAIIHYSVTPLTDTPITSRDMYLLDSGGQYLDGTTDVTRTFHFGSPTAYQKECYTRVLMGHINLFNAKWPRGLYGREIDAFARGPLWDVGLVYRHGTGHGIGMFLSVHEGPGRISLSHGSFLSDNPLDEFQFFSDEPGYYEDGQFGIRIENIVMVKNASTTHSFPGQSFLTFDHITLVPYEPNLIDYSLLNEQQVEYLNNYHKLCRENVGPKLQELGESAGYDWLVRKTAPVALPSSQTSGGSSLLTGSLFVALSLLASTVFPV